MPSIERSPRTKPSLTSLVAFFLIVTPLVYVLSYAPVVRVCGRTVVVQREVSGLGMFGSSLRGTLIDRVECADASVYPAYQPVDWMIDSTPLRRPLYFWAGLWGVREAFEYGHIARNPLPPFGRP